MSSEGCGKKRSWSTWRIIQEFIWMGCKPRNSWCPGRDLSHTSQKSYHFNPADWYVDHLKWKWSQLLAGTSQYRTSTFVYRFSSVKHVRSKMTATTSKPCVHYTPTEQSTHDNICKTIYPNQSQQKFNYTTIETCKSLLPKIPAKMRNS